MNTKLYLIYLVLTLILKLGMFYNYNLNIKFKRDDTEVRLNFGALYSPITGIKIL